MPVSMKYSSIICGIVAILVGASMLALGNQQTNTESETTQPSIFDGNIVVVYMDTEFKGPAYVVDKPKLQTIGGRLFLSGVGADTKRPADWRIGMDTNIAWSAITSFNVLTPEQFAEYAAGEEDR